jgi:hypothetical protein
MNLPTKKSEYVPLSQGVYTPIFTFLKMIFSKTSIAVTLLFLKKNRCVLFNFSSYVKYIHMAVTYRQRGEKDGHTRKFYHGWHRSLIWADVVGSVETYPCRHRIEKWHSSV